MNFIPVKRCNPYLSRRIGDVVGYVPHQFYMEILDAVFSGTVESWSDLPSNVQDVILEAEHQRRMMQERNSGVKQETLKRIDELKSQLSDLKMQLITEKAHKTIARHNALVETKEHMQSLRYNIEV